MLFLMSAALAAPVHVAEYAFDPVWVVHWEKDRIVTLSSSGRVHALDENLNEINHFEVGYNVNSITLSADGNSMSASGWRGRPAIYDVDTGDRLAKVPKPDRWSTPAVVVGDGGRYLVAVGGLLERSVDGAERVVGLDVWAAGPDALGYVGDTPYLWENGRLHIYEAGGERVLQTSATGWSVKPAGDGFVLYEWGRAAEYIGLDGTRTALGFGAGASSSFATSAELVAVVDATGTRVELWEHQTGTLRSTLVSGNGMIQSMAFSPDESRIVLASMDGILQVHEVPTRPQLDVKAAPGGSVLGIAVDQAGERAVAVWPDGEIVVWDLSTGAVSKRYEIDVQSGWGTHTVAASPDLSWLLYADGRGAAQRIDLSSGERVGGVLPASANQTTVAVGADGSFAVAADTWLRTWDAEGELVAELPMAPPVMMDVADGGTRLVTSDYQGVVTLWDAESGEVEATRTPAQQWGSTPFAIRLLEDEVVFVDSEGTHRWNPAGADAVVAYESPSLGALSTDGSAVALMSWTGTVNAQDLDGAALGDARWGNTALGSSVAALAVAGSGGLLMANHIGQVVWVDGDETQVLTGALPEVWGLDVSEGWVAVSHAFGVRVFDPGSGAARVLSDEGVVDLAFLPDGRVAGVDAMGREPPESAFTGEPHHYAWNVASGEREEGPEAWDTGAARDLGWDVTLPGAKLKRRQKRSLSGPIADCPDGSRVVGAEYGWGEESTLFIVRPDGEVLEADFSLTGQVAHTCGQIPGKTSAPGPILAAVGSSGGFVFLIDVESGETVAGLAGDGSQVTDIVQLDDGGVMVGYHSGAVRWFGADHSFIEERLFYSNGTSLAHDGRRLR